MIEEPGVQQLFERVLEDEPPATLHTGDVIFAGRAARRAQRTRRLGAGVAVASLLAVTAPVAVAAYSFHGADEASSLTMADPGEGAPADPAHSEQPTMERGISPPTTGARAAGSCRGEVAGRRDYGGASLVIHYEAASGRNCARLKKTKFVGQKSYLKLSLCNKVTGRCDRDWNYYTHYAGPVSVTAKGQCISWTVAVLNPQRTSWTQKETGGSGFCT